MSFTNEFSTGVFVILAVAEAASLAHTFFNSENAEKVKRGILYSIILIALIFCYLFRTLFVKVPHISNFEVSQAISELDGRDLIAHICYPETGSQNPTDYLVSLSDNSLAGHFISKGSIVLLKLMPKEDAIFDLKEASVPTTDVTDSEHDPVPVPYCGDPDIIFEGVTFTITDYKYTTNLFGNPRIEGHYAFSRELSDFELENLTWSGTIFNSDNEGLYDYTYERYSGDGYFYFDIPTDLHCGSYYYTLREEVLGKEFVSSISFDI